MRKDRKKKARREGKRDNKVGEKEGRKGGREGSERREREPFLRLAVSAQSGLGVNSAASSSIFLAVGFFASETASTVLCSGAETASKLLAVMLAAMALVLAAKSITATLLVLALVLEPVLCLRF